MSAAAHLQLVPESEEPAQGARRPSFLEMHARSLQLELEKRLSSAAHVAERDLLLRWLDQVQGIVTAIGRGALSADATEHESLRHFGELLRARRNAAALSRVELGKLARLSDATIKFLETAKHPPSRSTLIRLVGVEQLRLSWEEVAEFLPGLVLPAAGVTPQAPKRTSYAPRSTPWWETLGLDPLASAAEVEARFRDLGPLAGESQEQLDLLREARACGVLAARRRCGM